MNILDFINCVLEGGQRSSWRKSRRVCNFKYHVCETILIVVPRIN